mgnify:CR=1 FL=1
MQEKEKPSRLYRQRLAGELGTLRSTGKKGEAKERLSQERETPVYQLANVLSKSLSEKTRVPTHRDERNRDGENSWLVSNEPSLYQAFPYLKNCKGVGIGVCLDQMLDIAVNSSLEKVIFFDYSPQKAITTRALLEIGRRHHSLFGSYPSPQEYIS